MNAIIVLIQLVKNKFSFIYNKKFIYSKKHIYGYTIIELIIVFLIISSVLIVSYASYSSFNRTKHLESEAEKFVNILEFAKASAENSIKKSCTTLASVEVKKESTTGYSYTYNCLDTNPTPTPAIINFSDKSAIEFIDVTTDTTLFYPATYSATQNCYIIHHILSGECRKITISTFGVINSILSNCSCP